MSPLLLHLIGAAAAFAAGFVAQPFIADWWAAVVMSKTRVVQYREPHRGKRRTILKEVGDGQDDNH